MPEPPAAGLATVAAMTTWLRRLFVLAVIAGAAVAVWTALQRRNEPAASKPAPPAPPAPPTPPAPRAAPEPAAAAAPRAPTAERWREPVDGACPDGYPVKVAKSGIYHVPGGRSYERTTAERCYVNADDAEADGYRRAKA
jgi:hypothetical protein